MCVVKTITVGELRQNPTAMVDDVEAGEVYELTRRNRRVGYIVPAASSARIIPRKVEAGARTAQLPRHELRSAASIDELVAWSSGDW